MYAVVPADAAVPDLIGVADRRLETVPGVGAAVVVEECDRMPTVERSTAMRFAGILTDLNRSGPILPVRFPTVLPDRADVRDELRRHARRWARRLDDLDGTVEMVLRSNGSNADPTADDGESGGAYLRRRAETARSNKTLAMELRRTVEPWCREVRKLPSMRGVRMACLVAHEVVPKLRRALAEWQEQNGGRDVTLSGPWPPFSFVDEPEDTSDD